jgi:hypothetical protein
MDPIIAGLSSSPGALLDERRRPDFRDVFGTLASESSDIATAITRVRLSTVDLTALEVERLTSFRVLVAEVNALTLDTEARLLESHPKRAPNVRLIAELLRDGRLQIRSSPLAGWSPDFTVFGDASSARAVVTGAHWFERPYPHRGPAFGALYFGDAALVARRRHAELWEGAHDIGHAVAGILSRARAQALLGVAGAG